MPLEKVGKAIVIAITIKLVEKDFLNENARLMGNALSNIAQSQDAIGLTERGVEIFAAFITSV